LKEYQHIWQLSHLSAQQQAWCVTDNPCTRLSCSMYSMKIIHKFISWINTLSHSVKQMIQKYLKNEAIPVHISVICQDKAMQEIKYGILSRTHKVFFHTV
jgi:hypothetical protein